MPHPLWPGLCRGTGLLLRSWTRTSLCSSTARPGPCTCCPHRPPDHAPGLSFSVTQNLSCCRYSVSLTPPHFFTAPSSNSNNHMFQFSCSVLSDSLQPHGLQHCRLPCPSPVPEFSQTHVHGIGNAFQPSHHLSSPYPSALKLSQHQGLFQRVSSSHQVAKVLEFQLRHQSFQ